MSESVKREIKDVIDSVIAGDAEKLRLSLAYLAEGEGNDFLYVTRDLLKQTQPDHVGWLGFNQSSFYRSATHLLGVVYTPEHMLTSKANPSGVGLPVEVVKEIVETARAEYETQLIAKVVGLESSIKQLFGMVGGSAAADQHVAHIAQTHFTTGIELLFSTLNPQKRSQ